MLVKGAGSLIQNQPKKQERSQASKDDKSFQSVLDNTQRNAKKRKPLKSLAKKPVSKQKRQDADAFDQEAKPMKPVQKPKKNTEKSLSLNAINQNKKRNGQMPVQNKAMNKGQGALYMAQQKAEGKNLQEGMLMGQNGSVLAEQGVMADAKASQAIDNPLMKDFSLLQKGEGAQTTPLSLNSSEAQIKALEENIEKLEKFEKSFSDYVLQEVNKKKQATENLGMKAMQNNGTKSMMNDLKLESMTKNTFAEGAEVTANSQGAGVAGLSLKDFRDDGGASSEQSLDMNSMFAQGVEQDANVDNQSSFVEAMNEIDTQGQKAEKIENMQSIIKQARAFVDDGGGTMKIELSPEGLGKVHLKVAVQDGQVNVEMLADNKMAKQALEEGLVDIKNALEGQKLMVETLKVEMSQDYQKDFTDLRDHMQEQANRDFAEQFLGQFRQEREAKYGGLFDGFRNFDRGPQEPDLRLNKARNPYVGNGKGQTLNVVA